MRSSLFSILVLIVVITAACGGSADQTPTLRGAIVPTRITPTPTDTATPTNTATATLTFTPSATFTASATRTPTTTNTPTPTDTEAPTETATTPPTDEPTAAASPDTSSGSLDTISINLGDSQAGFITLENSAVQYTFEGAAGTVVTISMTAGQNDDLDPLLFVLGPDGDQIATNDDVTTNNKNSTIDQLVLPENGTYTIVATRFQQELGSTTGTFQLRLEEAALVSATDEPTASAFTASATPAANTDDQTIALGESVEGSINDDLVHVEYTFEASAGTSVDIRLTGDGDLDPLVKLLDADGNILTENDDLSTNDKNSAIEGFIIPDDGTYTIIATRFDEVLGFSSGDFTLTVSESGAAPDTSTGSETGSETGSDSAARPIFSTQPVAIGEEVQGELTDDEPIALYAFSADSGQRVRISVTAIDRSLDTFAVLIAPDGREIARNDDAARIGRASLIDNVVLEDAGEYILVVTTPPLASAGTGAFRVNITEGEDVESRVATLAMPVEFDEPVSGTLDRNITEHVFTFSGEQGDVINLEIETTGNLVPVFGVTSSKMNHIVLIGREDTFLGSGELPEDGFYSITVRARRGSGDFTLTLTKDE